MFLVLNFYHYLEYNFSRIKNKINNYFYRKGIMKLLSLTLISSLCCIACTSLNASFFYDDPAWQAAQAGQPWNHNNSQAQRAAAQPVSQEQFAALAATVNKAAQKNQQLKAEFAAKEKQQRIQQTAALQAKIIELNKENQLLEAALAKK